MCKGLTEFLLVNAYIILSYGFPIVTISAKKKIRLESIVFESDHMFESRFDITYSLRAL